MLTAAHCLEFVTAPQLRVTVGITSHKEPRQGQTRSVERISRHPLYTNSAVSFDYDAAVLTLGRPVKNIAPASIPATTSNELEDPGDRATIAGWGSTVRQPSNNEPNSPSRMQEAQVPIVSDAAAKDAYENEYTKALMLAAGEEGKDTCQGDSGGSIFVKDGTTGEVSQIGITSFGRGCGARKFPGVYTEANAEEIRPYIYRAAEN